MAIKDSQTRKAITTDIGYMPEVVGKFLLLKMPHTSSRTWRNPTWTQLGTMCLLAGFYSSRKHHMDFFFLFGFGFIRQNFSVQQL